MTIRGMAVSLCLIMSAPILAQSNGGSQPVMIGLDGSEYDACASLGAVVNLNPSGDNYLSVRAAPSTNAQELDRLGPGAQIWLCDGAHDGNWVGIVYGYDAQGEIWDCQALGLEPEPRAYDGPCQSGWVHGDYISVIAG